MLCPASRDWRSKDLQLSKVPRVPYGNSCDNLGTRAGWQAKNILRHAFDEDYDELIEHIEESSPKRTESETQSESLTKKSEEKRIIKAIYPNPAKDEFTVEYLLPEGVERAELIIYNVVGKEENRLVLYGNSASVMISASKLVSGLYLCKIVSSRQTLDTGRIAISK